MFKLIPNNRQLYVLVIMFVIFVIVGIIQFFAQIDFSSLLWLLAAMAVFFIGLDTLLLIRLKHYLRLNIKREMPHHFIVGQEEAVTLTLSIDSKNYATREKQPVRQALKLALFDHVPKTFEITNSNLMPVDLALTAGEYAILDYRVKPLRRGAESFTGTQVRLTSPMGFWQSNRFIDVKEIVKVYPDFRRLGDSELQTNEANSHGTLPHQRKRGSGTDFSELREYQIGDSLNHIDHKATSRMNKLMTKSFQVERDQQVIIMLDCSRRLRVFEQDLSHFDYALNSTIYLARMVLNQGDAVGLMNFGSGEIRYSKPRKGRNNVNRLLNQIYDLEPSKQAPDYVRAAEQLLIRQKRRSLVVFITSLKEEDTGAIKSMLRILQKRHLVLIANLKEESLGQPLNIQSLDDAIYYNRYGAETSCKGFLRCETLH